MVGVYRIPTSQWYNLHRVDKTKSWKDLYGDKKCAVCHQHFRQREAYTAMPPGKKGYRHVRCEIRGH